MLFRSFSSLPRSITGQDGEPINAVYGMLAFILRLTREQTPDHVAAGFDVPDVPTFRHALFPDYQGQRGPLGGEHADEFARQVSVSRDILPGLGIPALAAPGFEADDVMGSLARRVSAGGGTAVIVSTDRDLLQLVGPGIEVLVPGKEPLRIAGAEAVRQRIGVAPPYVTTFKALAGDTSDNIPGLPGIGPKTAIGLVEQFGALDEILAAAGEMQPRLAAKLSEGADMARLFQKVATIEDGLEIGREADRLPPLELGDEDRPRGLLERSGY